MYYLFSFVRTFEITLKCDEAAKLPGESDGVTETVVATRNSHYVGTLFHSGGNC